MATDSTITDSRAATIGLTLLLVMTFVNLSMSSPIENWLNNPCHYKPERQTRHSRGANHIELWKKQFTIAKNKYKELQNQMKTQYKQMHLRFKAKNCPSVTLPNKMEEQTPQNYFNAVREYALLLDKSANFRNLPKTVNFKEETRKSIFQFAVNVTKELLCEIYESLPEEKRTRSSVFTTNLVKSPHDVTKMLTQDYMILKCFGRFLMMSDKKIKKGGRAGKGGGKKKGGGKGKGKNNAKNKSAKKNQNKRKSNIAS